MITNTNPFIIIVKSNSALMSPKNIRKSDFDAVVPYNGKCMNFHIFRPNRGAQLLCKYQQFQLMLLITDHHQVLFEPRGNFVTSITRVVTVNSFRGRIEHECLFYLSGTLKAEVTEVFTALICLALITWRESC